MNEVKITYETLFDLLRREKTREELQELDETFYNDVVMYLQAKQSLLDDKGSQSGLFGASESEKVKLQIHNIKKIVKELFDRRITKIIKLAMNRSKAGAGISNTTAMLPEEKTFFDNELVLLNDARKLILDKILYFENLEVKEEVKKTDSKNVSTPSKIVAEKTVSDKKELDESEESENEPAKPANSETTSKQQDDDYEVKVTVKFKAAVPKFIGKKLESYGPYKEGDKADVPKIIANILINKDKADVLDSN